MKAMTQWKNVFQFKHSICKDKQLQEYTKGQHNNFWTCEIHLNKAKHHFEKMIGKEWETDAVLELISRRALLAQ